MRKISLLIVDDHRLIREIWVTNFEADARFSVVGQTGTGREALMLVKQLNPDIVIMDITLPDLNGVQVTKQIISSSPHIKVLGVSCHTIPAYARELMQSGACGYITKTSSWKEMETAIMEIQSGNMYICNEIKNNLSVQLLCNKRQENDLSCISRREICIINYIKNGLSSKEIAATLSISVKTVEVHRHNILKKLKLRNSTALINYINHSQLKFAV